MNNRMSVQKEINQDLMPFFTKTKADSSPCDLTMRGKNKSKDSI